MFNVCLAKQRKCDRPKWTSFKPYHALLTEQKRP